MIDVSDLKKRIEAASLVPFQCSPAFSAEERELLISALGLVNYSGKHEYPSRHGPGSRPSATLAWSLMDQLPPDAMKRHHRFMLAGMIAGAFEEEWKRRR